VRYGRWEDRWRRITLGVVAFLFLKIIFAFLLFREQTTDCYDLLKQEASNVFP
jgi:hypothetical protein